MGKQQKNTDGIMEFMLFIIIMGIIFFISEYAMLIMPIVVLVLFLGNLICYLVQDRKMRATNFWLSYEEQVQYQQTVNTLARAEDERRKVQSTVIIQGVSRNQDGQISQRSYAGKELRERENTANSLIDQYAPVQKALQYRPYMRWRKARGHYSRTIGLGVIVFILAVFEILRLTGVVDLSEISSLEILGISIEFTKKGIIAVLVIICFIGWLIGRIKFRLKNPAPPLVDMANVYIYISQFKEKRAKKENKR